MTKQEFKKIKSWLDKLLEEAIKERPLEIDIIKERLLQSKGYSLEEYEEWEFGEKEDTKEVKTEVRYWEGGKGYGIIFVFMPTNLLFRW